jgi:hypothetical protein
MVAHTFNPSYSGGKDGEDHGPKPAQAKSSQNHTSTSKKPGMVVHAFNSATQEVQIRESQSMLAWI